MNKTNELTASTAAAAIYNGELTSAALMASCIARIEQRDGDVQAWAYLDMHAAMAAARDADARQQDGAALGSLHGIPVAIKDIIDTADMPTEHGSPLYTGRRPNVDAACVAALRAAGAIILGKSVTTELANTNPSKTRNPHNLAHTPGGSSSGSGAAVADYQVPLALGTQTGGSVIRPASFNGIYGLKPTLGLIPRGGVLMQSHTLDTIGVYGRSLADLALITDVLSAPDPLDTQSYRGSRESLRAALATPLPYTPRFAFVRTPAWDAADAGAKSAILAVVDALGERCSEVLPASPFERSLQFHGAVFAGENAHYYGPHLRERPHLLSEKLRHRMLEAQSLSVPEYIEALLARDRIYASIERCLDGVDGLLCLSSAGAAPEGFATTGSPAFNSLWTYLGVPCVSLPRLSVGGLPLGLQLVGARGGEAHLLRAARWLDEWFER